MEVVLQSVTLRHPGAVRALPPALQAVSLRVAAGEQVAVIGPSGAGKTSLLHVLACAAPPAVGGLRLDGQDPWQLPARALRRLRAQLFLAPQVPPLPARQRVVTAVLAGTLPRMGLLRSIRSLLYPVGIAEADAALARLDLQDKLFARADRLSGGERQRVGLARALLAQARLLLVDEPLSALDPARADQALQVLTAHARERHATLVCTLHDVQLALQHFPRIVGMRAGQVAFDLPAAEVTPERLRTLYGPELEQLLHPPASDTPEGLPRPSVVVYCR